MSFGIVPIYGIPHLKPHLFLYANSQPSFHHHDRHTLYASVSLLRGSYTCAIAEGTAMIACHVSRKAGTMNLSIKLNIAS